MSDLTAADASTRAAIRQAQRRTPVPVCRPGRVLGVDPTSFVAFVQMDGDADGVITNCSAIDYLPTPGQRVRVLFWPPSDAVVLGTMAQTTTGANPVGYFEQPGAGIADVLVAPAFVAWPLLGTTTLTPPVWANSVLFDVRINGAEFAGVGIYQVRIVWGGVNGTAHSFQGTVVGGLLRMAIPWLDLFPVIGAGASTTFALQGLQVPAVGFLSYDIWSTISVAAHWLP